MESGAGRQRDATDRTETLTEDICFVSKFDVLELEKNSADGRSAAVLQCSCLLGSCRDSFSVNQFCCRGRGVAVLLHHFSHFAIGYVCK